MKLKFKQTNPDSALESLTGLLESILLVKTAQYEIESDINLDSNFFQDEKNYRTFFKIFSEYANPLWSEMWDFSKVPIKKPSKRIEGLISIVRSGGAYSDGQSLSEAQQVEEEFRFRFKGISPELVILSVVSYEFENDKTRSFSMDMKDLRALKKISPWFLQVAWDNLIFILNPECHTLYVIAVTDED